MTAENQAAGTSDHERMLAEALEAARGEGDSGTESMKAISESDQQRMLREAAEAMSAGEAAADEPDTAESNRPPWLWIAGAVVLLLGLFGWLALRGGGSASSAPAAERVAATESAPTAEAVAAVSTGSSVPLGGDSEFPTGQSDAPETDDLGAAEVVAAELGASAETEPVILPAPVPDIELARGVISDWADAWSQQDVDRYLTHYADGFAPPKGASREAWEANRRDRISRPEWIRVTLGPIDVSSDAEGEAEATFDQEYESPTYQDRVKKRVDLVWERDTWKIASEASE